MVRTYSMDVRYTRNSVEEPISNPMMRLLIQWKRIIVYITEYRSPKVLQHVSFAGACIINSPLTYTCYKSVCVCVFINYVAFLDNHPCRKHVIISAE